MSVAAALAIHPSVAPQVAERLLLVLERIEREPKRYDQRNYGMPGKDFDFKNREIRCDSACCVAGHIVAMFADENTSHGIMDFGIALEAMRLLGVPPKDQEIFSELFESPLAWPIRLTTWDGKGHTVTPIHLRQRIEHYIATGSMWPTPAPLD